jgi:5-methyltetrahydropteroyltriglutamate--homocysteine methyltransferase
MSPNANRILTSHIGSLPRPDALLAVNLRHVEGKASDEELNRVLASSVADVVRKQIECGIDIVNDGEYGKAMTSALDYGPWMGYAWQRLSGWEIAPADTEVLNVRDHDQFPTFYPAMWEEVGGSKGGGLQQGMECLFKAPVRYTGQKLVARDVANLQAATSNQPVGHAFITAVAPGSFNRGQDRHYPTSRDFSLALADALHEEYAAIVDAGFLLQIDDPSLADSWTFSPPSLTKHEYHIDLKEKVEAMNRALQGIPRDRVRYHVCWGSWHGPHTTDIPLPEILDHILAVNAGSYALEAGNVRHELDYQAWEKVQIPRELVIMPGVISHSTNLVEPAELIADRIARYAAVFGRERVIAGTDCGLGGRIHPEIAWAKLRALADGARLATQRLWRN